MATILGECPYGHKKSSLHRKACKCGTDLEKAKKAKKVTYHLVYRVDGKQKLGAVASFHDLDPYSLDDARKAEAKLIVAKEEGKIKIFEKEQETRWTFQEITDWFMEKILPGRVIRKGIKSPKDIDSRLRTFDQTFGHVRVSDIKLMDLQNYQAILKAKGLATGTIDNRNESRGNRRFKVVFH